VTVRDEHEQRHDCRDPVDRLTRPVDRLRLRMRMPGSVTRRSSIPALNLPCITLTNYIVSIDQPPPKAIRQSARRAPSFPPSAPNRPWGPREGRAAQHGLLRWWYVMIEARFTTPGHDTAAYVQPAPPWLRRWHQQRDGLSHGCCRPQQERHASPRMSLDRCAISLSTRCCSAGDPLPHRSLPCCPSQVSCWKGPWCCCRRRQGQGAQE
jgi:hypothetical protein